MAVTTLGEIAWSISEVAAVLESAGQFSSLAEAFRYVQADPAYWTKFAQTVEGLKSYTAGVSVTSGGAATAVTSTTSTALEVAQTSSMAATQKVVKSGVVSVAQKSATEFSLKAVMGMELGTVAAACAPLLGVSLGVDLYNSNPELWTKISQKLLPFCYPGTTQIPTWADIAATAWTTSIAKQVVDALRELFKDEGIGVQPEISEDLPSGHLSAGVVTPGYSDGSFWFISVTGGPVYFTSIAGYGNYASGSPFSVTLVQYGGSYKTIIGAYNSTYNIYTAGSGVLGGGNTPYASTCSVADFYNSIGGIPQYTYPSGTSEWTGWHPETPSQIPLSDPIVVDDDGNVIDTVPISPAIALPSSPGLPVPSNSSDDYPNPTVTYNPESQIDPWLLPAPNPIDTPTPDPNAEPNIDNDPSDPTPPSKKIVDLIPPIPPTGISPWPAMPGTPNAFASDIGLVTVYHPSATQLYAFERWLWVTLSQADIDTVWNNPFDGVIGLFELYCTPTDIGTRTIHSGFLDSQVPSPIISRYTEINCGTVAIPEYYGNYFDYSPYSKAHVYLPFIGIQELNVDDIVGHAVNITYRIDEYNGSCIAMITVAKVTNVNGEEVSYSNTMYQFSGNCAVELPISGGSQASIRAGLMTANAYQQAANIASTGQLLGGIGSLIGGIIGLSPAGIGHGIGSILGAGASAAYGQANALSNMLSGKSTVQKSGQFGASYGAMGIKNPFITITRPKQIQILNYNDLYGFPAHKMVTIGACTGFLRCREVHVISARANDDEKSMIESMLKSGVYVTE